MICSLKLNRKHYFTSIYAMNSKLLGIILFITLFFVGCSDNTGTMGWGLMPAADVMKSQTVTYDVITRSVKADSVYARSSTGYIGRYSDPNFGYYEASFLTELNCLDDYSFPEVYSYDEATGKAKGVLVDDRVRDFKMVVYYSTWFGDSLNACRMSAYKLNDTWVNERNVKDRRYRYTNIDVEKYYNKEDLIGSKAYTAYDATVSAEEHADYTNYFPHVSFQLKIEDGQHIFDLSKQHPEYFKNSEEFIKHVFPGIYLKSDFGDGTILYVNRVDLTMTLAVHYLDDNGVKLLKKITDDQGEAGSDSIALSTQIVFASTKEVIQANKFTNSDKLDARVAETENTYVKSPVGIFTSIEVPYEKISNDLKNDTINAVSLKITNYEQKSAYDFSMNVPTYLLLIRAKDVKSFFEGAKVTDNVTTYYAQHNLSSNNTYSFPNIARLISTTIREKEEEIAKSGSWNNAQEAQWQEDNKLLLIPVEISAHTDYYQNVILDTMEHDLEPTYAKLIGGPDNPLQLQVVYTSFK